MVIGLTLALVYTLILRRRFSGDFWGAAVVAIIGTFLGGLVDYFFGDTIQQLTSINGVLNIFPPLIAGALLLNIFARMSEHKDTWDD